MKKIVKYTICLFCALATLSACESWLDVTPSSQIREDEQFGSEAGFQQALLGCYINMTSDTLYGTNLSWFLPDVMSQTYHTFLSSLSGGKGYFFQNYNFTNSRITGVVESIWRDAYNVIANANNALKFIEKNKAILQPTNYTLIKGELLAIRGYMHFELLRIYGYGNLANRADKDTKLTIPYVVGTSKEATPQSTYSGIVKRITDDLNAAATLLELDPITGKQSVSFYAGVNAEGFYDKREMRLNYYAVKALLARVYMWEGSQESLELAKAAAVEVIDANEARNIFPWVINDVDKNTVLSTEHLFSLNVSRLDQRIRSYFMNEFKDTDYSALYIGADTLKSIYEVNKGIGSVDIRYTKLYYTNQDNKCVPLKLYQPVNYTYKNRVPMIRIPELYYMAAECYGLGVSSDFVKAKQLIRKVRESRGVTADFECDNATSLLTELKKEYRKEFVAEGVLFYFYKRIGQSDIINSAGTVIPMSDATYTFPYPEFEIQTGRVQ